MNTHATNTTWFRFSTTDFQQLCDDSPGRWLSSADKPPPVALETFQSFPFAQHPSFRLGVLSFSRGCIRPLSSRLRPSSQRPRCWTGGLPGVVITTAGMTFLLFYDRSVPRLSLAQWDLLGMGNQAYPPRKELPHRGTPSGKASKPYRVESSHEWISGISQPGA